MKPRLKYPKKKVSTPPTERPRIEVNEVPLGYRLPPTKAPPMDLTDFTQQPSDYWRTAARNTKP